LSDVYLLSDPPSSAATETYILFAR